MGDRGPLPKDTELPILRTTTATPAVPEGVDADVWHELWTSAVSRAWDPVVDTIAVERYVTTLRRWATAREQVERLGDSPVTIGSQGQPVIHPMTKYVDSLENRLAQLEKELGLTPMSRARLGLTIGSAQLTAQQINQMARE